MEAKFERAPQVIVAEVDGEPLLLHLDSWTYLSFNPVGARIWELLETPRGKAELIGLLGDEFDADDAVIARDVTTFLDGLESDAFVVVAAGAE
jgi:hypothetical protein